LTPPAFSSQHPRCPSPRTLRGLRSRVGLAIGSTLTAALILGCGVGAATASSPRAQSSAVFSFTGAKQYVLVPDWATSAEVRAVGGAGGSVHSGHCDVEGGTGTIVTAVVPVTSGEELTIWVGGKGQDGQSQRTVGGGWSAAQGGSGTAFRNGSGAGAGGGATILGNSAALEVVAGAGGGAGGCSPLSADGGDGGSNRNGHNGANQLLANGGLGGTIGNQSSGNGADGVGGGGGGGGQRGGGGGGKGSDQVHAIGGHGGGGSGTSWTATNVGSVTINAAAGTSHAGELSIIFR
jgi:hypothetical protein